MSEAMELTKAQRVWLSLHAGPDYPVRWANAHPDKLTASNAAKRSASIRRSEHLALKKAGLMGECFQITDRGRSVVGQISFILV